MAENIHVNEPDFVSGSASRVNSGMSSKTSRVRPARSSSIIRTSHR